MVQSAPLTPVRNEILIEDDNSDLDVQIIEKKKITEKKKIVVKAKLFQFHTNNRPAYFGSWNKKSEHISPRNPFRRDTQVSR